MKNLISLFIILLTSTNLFASSSTQEVYNLLEQDFLQNPYFQNKNINLNRDGSMSPYIKEVSSDYLFINGRPLSARQLTQLPEFEFVSYDVFEKAYHGYKKIMSQGLLKKEILIIVDYSKHSTFRRLYVFDLKNLKVLFNTWTQHGTGSDRDNRGIPQIFSNTPGSDQTSLGFMVTAETYVGMWGYSMRMNGIDPLLNSKVRARAVVMHGNGRLYAESATFGNVGYSQGCITLPIYESGKFYGLQDKSLNELIINTVKNGALIFSYSDVLDGNGILLLNQSKWLKD